jgi:hypothetical protein
MEEDSEIFYTWKPLNSKVLLNGYNPGVFLLGCAGMLLCVMIFISTFSLIFLFLLFCLFYYFIIIGLQKVATIKKASDRKGQGDIEAPDKKKYLEGMPKKYIDTDNFINYLIKEKK